MFWIAIMQMGLYGPNSSEWLQIGHDYKKSRRAPLKCNTPATTSRIWTKRESSNSVYNLVYDRNNDGYTEILALSDSIVLRDATNGNYIFGVPCSGSGCVGSRYVAVGRAGSSKRIFLQEPDRCLIRVRDAVNGSLIYSYSFCSKIDVYPTVLDYDNNGCAEIITGVGQSTVLLDLCSNSYSPYWQTNTGGVYLTVAVGTFNGVLSAVVLSRDSGNIFLIRVSDGIILAKYNIFGVSSSSNKWTAGPLVWDITSDGNDEIFLAYKINNTNYIQSIRVNYDWTYTTLWTRSGVNYSLANQNWMGNFLAIGRILNNNNFGISFVSSSQKVHVIRASDGSIVTTTIPSDVSDYARGDPSIADLNGDGIEGVVFSTYCGKPTEYSYVNNWTSHVWQADVCADDPPITSDLIIAKYYINYAQNPPKGQILLVEGDYSCYTNVWLCQGGEETTPLSYEETQKHFSIVVNGKNVFIYSNLVTPFQIYNTLGRKVAKGYLRKGKNSINLNYGIYFLHIKAENQNKIIVVK